RHRGRLRRDDRDERHLHLRRGDGRRPGRARLPRRGQSVNAVAARVARCPHCGAAVEGQDDAYCCGGCALAAEIIREAGAARYYAEREEYAPRPAPGAGAWDRVPVEVVDGVASVRLGVDGLRCASCVWVLEKVLDATPGVT